MRWAALIVLTAGLAGSVLAPSTAAGTQRDQRASVCPPGGRAAVAADAQAEIYRVRRNQEEVEYRGCVYGHSRSFEVGLRAECISDGGACGGTSHLTLAGTLVAREKGIVSPVSGNSWLIEVEDLRTGKVIRQVPTGATYPPNPRVVGDGPATAIVLKGDGAVAWIVDTVQETDRYQVHAVDSTGSRLLASGSDIDPSSLALAGSTLYWTEGGKSYSTTLN